MLPEHLNNYFIKLETIYHYQARQKAKNDFFHTFARTEWRRKTVQCRILNIWKKYLLY